MYTQKLNLFPYYNRINTKYRININFFLKLKLVKKITSKLCFLKSHLSFINNKIYL